MEHSDQLSKVRRFLTEHDYGVIASSSPHGHPHASVANYFMEGNSLDIYFLAREHAQKFRNILTNPWAALVVFDHAFVSTVEVKGQAEKLEDSPQVTELLMRFARVIRQKNGDHLQLPLLKTAGSELYLFKLKPHTLAYADFRPSHQHDGEFFELTL